MGVALHRAPGGARLLLDTHALVWWWTDDRRLTGPARAAIAAPGHQVLVSAASAWEIATRLRLGHRLGHRLGKWDSVAALVTGFENFLRRSRFAALPITPADALAAGALDWAHRDPFDRLLLAQARAQAVPLVSGDEAFRGQDIAVIW